MARQARKISNTGIYHIILRGNNGQEIFIQNEDYLKFLYIIKSIKEKNTFNLFGYCIMENHAHLLIQEISEPISDVVKRICSTFVYWYNQKYERFGHLFQERFKSVSVETENYLFAVLRYIHQNPIKSGVSNGLTKYKWTSYNEYLKNKYFVDTDYILSMFSTNKATAKKLFINFMHETDNDSYMENKIYNRISDEDLNKIIEEKYGIKYGIFNLADRNTKKLIIKELKQTDGVSIRQIVRVTGLSKYHVEIF